MSANNNQYKRPVKEKKVSFSVTSSSAEHTIEKNEKSNSNVEISAFPQAEIKSILRLNPSGLKSPSTQTKTTPRLRNRKPTSQPEVKTRTPRRVQSFKEPTESVKHALLRSMSHREPDEKTRRFLSKALPFQQPKFVSTYQPQTIETPRASRDTAEILASNIDQSKVSICCGHCKRTRKVFPAVGFCKYCTEYLCAQCVVNHRSRLTRSHPVVVFYCQQCKELKILNDRGAGHCVECKVFYCARCVVEHCAKTEHAILEGKDLLDVVEFIIQK